MMGHIEILLKKSVDNGVDRILLNYVKYNGGIIYQKSKVVMSYGTIGSALVTMYGNTEKELMKELYLFTCSEIMWCLIDKNEEKIWNFIS